MEKERLAIRVKFGRRRNDQRKNKASEELTLFFIMINLSRNT